MSLLRSIRNQLALLFLAIAAVAVAGIYAYVVPQLESSLREEKLRELTVATRSFSEPIVRAIGTNVSVSDLNRAVRRAADRAGTRVTLLGVSRGTQGLQTYPISDSAADPVDPEDVRFAVALEAARTGRVVTGTEPTNAGRIGEAARPLFFNERAASVVVYSSPLGDVQSNVAVIRRRLVIAGAIAVGFALLAGYWLAGTISRRVRRLEAAADKVAAGDFSHKIPVDSDDELGQLARAFNDMQRQLAQLDDARKRFIATASHELRTPIFSLGGFVELLEDEDIDEETRRQFLVQIRLQIARLTRLATELLDLSRLEAGSLELRTEDTDVAALAKAVTSEFAPALSQHASRLDLELDGHPIQARCDPERVAQIIRILIDNALVHTPRGTEIQVSAQREDGRVRLAVRDEGLGIKRTVMGHIFEPFYTSDDAHGSGLGLAIARELAESMDGSLVASSSPGRTTFTLELPV